MAPLPRAARAARSSGPHVAIVPGTLRVDATGRLSLPAHNNNAFAIRKVSMTMTSVAAAKRHKLTFLRNSKAVRGSRLSRAAPLVDPVRTR